jgi:hypothetical protein
MSDVTRILSAIEQGDSHAANELLPLVYGRLVPCKTALLSRPEQPCRHEDVADAVGRVDAGSAA